MKTKKPIFRLVALAALSFFTGNEVVAQVNNGAACGCPTPVLSRTAANIKTAAQAANVYSALPTAAYGGEITGNFTLTCDKLWTLDEKLYVAAGATLTIEPGTVILSNQPNPVTNVAAARALIIERGGKIIAAGTEDCPIIFTATGDPLNGTLGVKEKGLWGGVLLCGKATNNLTLAANGPFIAGQSGKLAVADGVGVLEGFASSIPQDQFGAGINTAPSGFVLATNPTPNAAYSFTTVNASSAQNSSAQTSLVLTAAPAAGLVSALISGTGTAPGATIQSISSSTITMSSQSTAPLSGSFLVGATRSTAAANQVAGTSLTLTAANAGIETGMKVSGTGILANTTVAAYNSTTYEVTLSTGSTTPMSGTYVFALPLPTGVTATVNASGATSINITNPAIRKGMVVAGTGIATGTLVLDNTGTAITLSAATTAALSSTALTFTWTSLTAADVLNCTGATKIKLSAANAGLQAGQTVTGTGAAGINIIGLAYSSSIPTITLASALTANIAGSALTIGGLYPSVSVPAFYPSVASGSVNATETSTGSGVFVNYASPSVTQGIAGFDDNDNSGIMTYVSIRYSGANLLVGSEINGLTLASVGRGTKIENIEIVSCADDNIEIFGGTVNLKYCTTLFGNDDMYDYDLGWTGKAQFLFGMKANQFTTAGGSTVSDISLDNDHGFECDGDDGQSYNLPKSAPQIYNATVIGNDKVTLSADNTSLAAICAKENAGGTINNSIFANFRSGLNLKQSMGTASALAKGGEAYHNWANTGVLTTSAATGTGGTTTLTLGAANSLIAVGMKVAGPGVTVDNTNPITVATVSTTTVTLSGNLSGTAALSGTYTFTTTAAALVGNGSQSLKIKCNTFVNPTSITGGGTTVNTLAASVNAGSTTGTVLAGIDDTQFFGTDKNISVTSLTGFSAAFLINGATNAITTKNDVVPSPQLNVQLGTGCAPAPLDGFFAQVNYRGAFKPSLTNENWLSDWSYSQVLSTTKGVVACPTDLDSDGDTDVDDFGIFAPKFGTNCN